MPSGPLLTPTKWLALGLIALVVGGLIFLAGVGLGSHREIFLSSQGGMMGGSREFSAFGIPLPHVFIMRGGHGAVGAIQSVASSSLVVSLRDGGAQTILVASTTVIETPNGPAHLAALQAGQHIVVIGEPHEAGDRISARLIRVLQ